MDDVFGVPMIRRASNERGSTCAPPPPCEGPWHEDGPTGLELLVRVGLATLLGIAIGIERQWRSRMAGLQTIALVDMGSGLFTILGAYDFPHAGRPRQGRPDCHGHRLFGYRRDLQGRSEAVWALNTAATLWAVSAVGGLCGGWMWREAVVGVSSRRR